jgi:hypothetical protein
MGLNDRPTAAISRSGAVALLAVTALISLAGGCSVTRKGATVDSTSRMPFFNMELAPKAREPAPETQRI